LYAKCTVISLSIFKEIMKIEFNTPQAIRQIKLSPKRKILIDGKNQCILQAMLFALKYHEIFFTETFGGLMLKGIVPVGN
jgi:hypothetical protein